MLVNIVLSTTILFSVTRASNDCTLLSSNYFQWLNDADGSLVLPASEGITNVNEDDDMCCGPSCSELWESLPESPECQFCSSKRALVCQGSSVHDVPASTNLPSSNLSLFKMSGVGLISLPPNSFANISIQKLIIENSNLTYIASNTFSGVKSITSLYLRNNTLDYLPQAGFLFHNIRDLNILSLENNGLKVLTSLQPANMNKLKYFSLAGNPIYSLDVFFLQNSGLTFLDLKGVTFKMKVEDLASSGLRALPSTLNALDLSRAKISVGTIQEMMWLLRGKNITTLNLSFLESGDDLLLALRPIRTSLQHLSLQGTDMSNVYPLKSAEKKFFHSGPFISLRELSMRNCNITYLETGEMFEAFPNLNILSLSENQFFSIDINLFSHVPNLNYMDLSNNTIMEVYSNCDVSTSSLSVMDLSLVDFGFGEEESIYFFNAFKRVKKLSLCNAKIDKCQIRAIQNLTSLQALDVSGTLQTSPDSVSAYNDLFGVLNSLTELHFARNEFKSISIYPEIFSQLPSLETLDLSYNLIRDLSQAMLGPTLKQLKIAQNLITTWYFSLVNNRSQLNFVDLSSNQITYVSDAMLQDFNKLNSLNLNSNPLMCHNKVVAMICSNMKNSSQALRLVDSEQYRCYDIVSKEYRQFSEEKDCEEYYEEVSTTQKRHDPRTTYDLVSTTPPTTRSSRSAWNWEWGYKAAGAIVLTAVVGSIVYLKWWNIRCYIHRYLSLKKAHLLRKSGNLMAKTEVQYDVFVSYSDVDRSWVLDHLVPSMETEGDISLCFHERDFQVGLSILENIIDCMDRSHSLMLVVSSAFVRSKWCQFEMHLAQYRLIETLRDQLVLVLLEDIPRKTRPQTLHHLMMTKTYLVWPSQPCKEDARELFWKRLKRALRPNHLYIFDV